MLETLDKARKLPEEERKTIAFIVALVVTGIITIVWFVSLFSGGGAETDVVEEAPSPFEGVARQTTEIFSGIGAQFGAFRDQIEGLTTEENPSN